MVCRLSVWLETGKKIMLSAGGFLRGVRSTKKSTLVKEKHPLGDAVTRKVRVRPKAPIVGIEVWPLFVGVLIGWYSGLVASPLDPLVSYPCLCARSSSSTCSLALASDTDITDIAGGPPIAYMAILPLPTGLLSYCLASSACRQCIVMWPSPFLISLEAAQPPPKQAKQRAQRRSLRPPTPHCISSRSREAAATMHHYSVQVVVEGAAVRAAVLQPMCTAASLRGVITQPPATQPARRPRRLALASRGGCSLE
jgi:hypothetical protein